MARIVAFLLSLLLVLASSNLIEVFGQETQKEAKKGPASEVKSGSTPTKLDSAPPKPTEKQAEKTQPQPAEKSKDKEKTAKAVPLPAWSSSISARNLGPALMGGRITSLAVVESDPSTWWVATASGGLLKTTNHGNSFTHHFDREATISIGDVAVSPSNPSTVWVGCGENNPRNSVSWGNGVYKSEDSGKPGSTWA
jgi:hypothetical protein